MAQTSIKNLLNTENQTLGTLIAQVAILNRWNGYLADCLPGEEKLLKHCQIARLQGSELIIVAENPHWATRFRFHITNLLIELQKYPDFQQVKKIHCKVRPPQLTRVLSW